MIIYQQLRQFLKHTNEFFLELFHFNLYILNSRSKLEGLLPFFIHKTEW